MHLKPFGAACAALATFASGGASAQATNLSIYGELDLGYKHTSSGELKTNGIDSILSSRIGFKGEEALGNDLKAILTLEYALTPDVNSGIGPTTGTAARETSLALQGSYGKLSAGRMPTPGHRVTLKYDAISAQYSPLETLTNGNGTNFVTSIDPISRLDNFVTYATPAYIGLTATIGYSFGGFSSPSLDTAPYRSDSERVIVAQLEYENGPLSLTYVRHQIDDLGAPLAPAGTGQKENLFGGIYDFGAAKLYATWQDVRQNATPADRVWSVGLRIPVGPARVDIGYAKFENGRITQNSDSASWALAYSYPLSKRTRIYSGYQRVKLDAGTIAQNRAWAFSRVLPTAASSNGDSSGYIVGLHHKF